MNLKKASCGLAAFLAGLNPRRSRGTGGTDSAAYCYSVWLRHLILAQRNGLNAWPRTVAELGPGDSLGIGLAALLSGSDRYFALDVVEHTDADSNLKILDELVGLFRAKADVPGNDEFPEVKPHLDDYSFPADLLGEHRLGRALAESRIERISKSIAHPELDDSPVKYKVPWQDASVLEEGTIDMILSQAVLEHVDDLRKAYRSMQSWLSETGFLSHQIDFKCHGTSYEWNGHWTYGEFAWRLIRGIRPYLLNREPHSTHLSILREEGFKVVCDLPVKSRSFLAIDELAPRFRSISSDDLTTSGAFIQAVRAKKHE